MTPNNILNTQPIQTYKSDGVDNEGIFYFLKNDKRDAIPEVACEHGLWCEAIAKMNNRLMINVFMTVQNVQVSVLYYSYIPVMILRDGTDYNHKWIINAHSYMDMVTYLQELLETIQPKIIKETPMDEIIF